LDIKIRLCHFSRWRLNALPIELESRASLSSFQRGRVRTE
jgi:hypothetical protein